MTQPTLSDDDLGALLTETFRANEHLADTDRAVAIASAAPSRRHAGPMLLGAAAAVVLVVAGSAYVVSRGGDERSDIRLGPAPTSGTVPGRTAADVSRANQEFAEHITDDALERLRERAAQMPGGAREVRAGDVPALAHLMSYIGPGYGHDFTRSAFLEAPGDAHQVALWFAAHPPVDAISDGGPTGVGGSRNADGSWSDEVLFDYPSGPEVSQHASLASLVQVTPQGSGVGIRVTVFGSWRPGRPAASFAHDVESIRVRVTDWVIGRNGGHARTTHHTWTLTSPSEVGRVVSRYNALPGGAAVGMSCPMPRATRTYHLAFATSSGTLTVTGRTGCGAALSVQRGARQVPPLVDSAEFFPFLDRELSLPSLGLHR